MKNISKISVLAIAAAAVLGCAKAVPAGTNDAAKRYFDAWLAVNAPDAERTGRGTYVVSEEIVREISDGAIVEKDGFVVVRYKISTLEREISEYTDKETAEQLGKYNPASYYGVKIWTTTPETIRAGVYDALMGMKAGHKKTFIVPSWMMSYSNFATEAEYLAQENEFSNTIYEVEIIDFVKNINDWQLLKMRECFSNPDFYDGAFASTQISDSTSLGFYFKMLNKVESKKEFPKDTTIYINYTGSLLDIPEFDNGLVFDTSVENVAKDNFLYSSSKSYSPATVKWGEKHSEITMSGSNVVSGFSQTLWNMANCAPGTKAVGVFYSDLGYGYNGSGNIPAYSPLVFEIEIVEKPE